MITVDLSANCEGRIFDPNGSGIQILGIRSRDPFSGSMDIGHVCLGQISVTEAILVHCGVVVHVPPIHNTRSWQTITELCCLVCQQ